MKSVTNSWMASKKKTIATYKAYQKQNNPIADRRSNTISTATYKRIEKWRRNSNPVAELNTNDNKANNVHQHNHFSNAAHVGKASSKSLGNDNTNGSIFTISATSNTSQSYLQVALALKNRTTPSYPVSGKNSKHYVHSTKLIATLTTITGLSSNREPRYKKLKPNQPPPQIVYCKSIKQETISSVSSSICSVQPTPSRFSLSSTYIDKIINKPNSVLDLITAQLQARKTKTTNYYSALFEDDEEEDDDSTDFLSDFTMTDNNSAINLTGNSTGRSPGDDDDNDCKPAAIVPKALKYEPAPKKKVNPMFTSVWKNIHTNVADIAKGTRTFLTLDQVKEAGITDETNVASSDNEVEIIESPWTLHTNHKAKKDDPYGNTIANVSPVVIPSAPRTSPTPNIGLEYTQPARVLIFGPAIWESNRNKRIPIFKINRILLSILYACQQVDPEARLGNVDLDLVNDDILSHNEIPATEEREREFIFGTKVQGNRFEGQIVIKSNIPIHLIQLRLNMHAWTAQERIHFIKQHHSNVEYIEIGFFIRVCNRDQMDDHHTKTLRKWLPEWAPAFQLKSQVTTVRSKAKVVKQRVLFVLCEEADEAQIKSLIAALQNHTWKYTSLIMYNMQSPEARIKLIEPHGQYTSSHYNFLLYGFKSTGNELMMNHASTKRSLETAEEEANETMTDQEESAETIETEQVNLPPAMKIEDFIHNYWVDDNDYLLYRRVGPAIDGSRELTIHRDNVYLKESLMESLLGDLYPFLTDTAAELCFDVEKAIQQMVDNKNKATPQSPAEYLVANDIVIEPSPIEDEKGSKRARNGDSPPTTVATTPSTVGVSTLTYTPGIPPAAAISKDEVQALISNTTKVLIAEELAGTLQVSVNGIIDGKIQYQDRLMQTLQDQIAAQENSLRILQEKLSNTDGQTQNRLNILGDLVRENQFSNKKSMGDNQLLMLTKFAEADDKAEKKFDALMNAFNKTRIDQIIPSHHCPTLTSNLKAPPMSYAASNASLLEDPAEGTELKLDDPAEGAELMLEDPPTSSVASAASSTKKASTAKAAPAKGKPNVNKNRFVIPQHYAARNPYAKKPSSEFEQSDAIPPAVKANQTTPIAFDSTDRINILSTIIPSLTIPSSSHNNPSSSISSSSTPSSLEIILPRGTTPPTSSTSTTTTTNITTIPSIESIANSTTTTQYIQTAIDFQPYNYTQEDQQTWLRKSNKQTEHMTQNYRENIECGDTFHIKEENTTRIYFQTIRGCKKSNSWKDWQYATKYLHDNQVDIIGYAETNLYWDERHQQQAKEHTQFN